MSERLTDFNRPCSTSSESAVICGKYSDVRSLDWNYTIYLLREARHVGLALGLDSVRFLSIDVNVRAISDYLILKSQGIDGLAKDLRWLYSLFHPHAVRQIPPQHFLILSKTGSVGVGQFPEVSWHKQEQENILKQVGVTVEYLEPVQHGVDRGTHKTVGDQEHAEIVQLYADGLSYNKIANQLGRSSRTAMDQVKRHNKFVETGGYCVRCQRVNGEHDSRVVQRAP